MNKEASIAAALSLAVITLVFGMNGIKNLFPAFSSPVDTKSLVTQDVFKSDRTPLDANPAEQAWDTFKRYVEAAREHDLNTLGELSHQLSPACQDPEQREECNRLMDGVSFFAGEFQREAFSNIEYDSRQLVMYTDYIDGERTMLYFTRTQGEPKVLGIRFCTETGDELPQCFDNPSVARQDSDGDGWWDAVEASFR